jgi:hypothetical protein
MKSIRPGARRPPGERIAAWSAASLLAGGVLAADTGPACPAPVINGTTATVTCQYTGGSQYWTVPAGVTQATLASNVQMLARIWPPCGSDGRLRGRVGPNSLRPGGHQRKCHGGRGGPMPGSIATADSRPASRPRTRTAGLRPDPHRQFAHHDRDHAHAKRRPVSRAGRRGRGCLGLLASWPLGPGGRCADRGGPHGCRLPAVIAGVGCAVCLVACWAAQGEFRGW